MQRLLRRACVRYEQPCASRRGSGAYPCLCAIFNMWTSTLMHSSKMVGCILGCGAQCGLDHQSHYLVCHNLRPVLLALHGVFHEDPLSLHVLGLVESALLAIPSRAAISTRLATAQLLHNSLRVRQREKQGMCPASVHVVDCGRTPAVWRWGNPASEPGGFGEHVSYVAQGAFRNEGPTRANSGRACPTLDGAAAGAPGRPLASGDCRGARVGTRSGHACLMSERARASV